MTQYVGIDFETASSVDLKTAGAWRYAEDPTTEILCLVYQANEEGHVWWFPGWSTQFLHEWADDPGVIFVAHNAGFEQAIWHHLMVPLYGLPALPIERWEDTMATCAWKSLPLRLEKAASALDMDVQKDMEGNRLTLALSRFDKKTGMWPERTLERLDRIAAYCEQDVRVEGGLRSRLGLLSEQSVRERDVWLLDQRINQRGVRIDLDFVRQAQLVVERASKPLLVEFRDLTGGINPGQVAAVIGWAETQGVLLDNLQKGYLADLLGADDDADDAGYISNAEGEDDGTPLDGPALPAMVRRVLAIRQMLGSASIKKLARMRACVSSDGRARGLVQYHAASTGRWGGRLLQPQNFPRGVLKVSPDAAVSAIMTGDPEYVEAVLGAPAIECVASSLRHALIPDPGHRFFVGDFAGIEARIVLALAGQHDKTALMASGHDVYLDMASLIFGEPVTRDDPRRQFGKNGVLGCGFQCGAINFNMKFLGGTQLDLAYKTVGTYREEWAPKVPRLWYGIGDAALAAATDGRSHAAYGVTYRRQGDWLTAKLPSGWQTLHYFSPRLGIDDKFNRPCWTYMSHKQGKTVKVKAYGGLLVENAVQGLARGLLVASMMRVEQAGMPIVLTVHDEIVAEVPEGQADLAAFEQTMAEATRWSNDIKIPIMVESWQGDRYRK